MTDELESVVKQILEDEYVVNLAAAYSSQKIQTGVVIYSEDNSPLRIGPPVEKNAELSKTMREKILKSRKSLANIFRKWQPKGMEEILQQWAKYELKAYMDAYLQNNKFGSNEGQVVLTKWNLDEIDTKTENFITNIPTKDNLILAPQTLKLSTPRVNLYELNELAIYFSRPIMIIGHKTSKDSPQIHLLVYQQAEYSLPKEAASFAQCDTLGVFDRRAWEAIKGHYTKLVGTMDFENHKIQLRALN